MSEERWSDRRRRFGPRTFRQQIVLSTVALVTAVMVLAGVGLQLVLGYTAQRDIRTVLVDRSEATIQVIQQASGRRLVVPADALDPGVQVYDADGNLVAGAVERRVREVAEDLARTTTTQTRNGPTDDVQLLGTPFTTPSGEDGVLVVSQETTPYERSEFYALLATLVLAVLVIGGTALIARRVTRQALAPVAQMAERAADWSEHDLTHRFGLGPPDNELAALGETLDHLLDRVASAILSEQRLTAELAHELRTPLTSIQGSADLALMRGIADPEVRRDLEQISLSSREMTGVISTLLDLARTGGVGGRDRTCLVADVVADLLKQVRPGIEVVTDLGAPGVRIDAPATLVVRAVSPVVANAVRHAASRVELTATDGPDRVLLSVVDDGPGVVPELRHTLFDAGVTHGSDGAGLGLGIARRVARSFGGEIELDLEHDGGAAFVVSLPRR